MDTEYKRTSGLEIKHGHEWGCPGKGRLSKQTRRPRTTLNDPLGGRARVGTALEGRKPGRHRGMEVKQGKCLKKETERLPEIWKEVQAFIGMDPKVMHV